MFPSKINSFHKFAKGLSAFGKYNTSENASELRQHTIEELSGFLNSIENEYNHLLFHISELLHISDNIDKLDEYILKAIVENIHNNSFKSYVDGFAFLLVNSSGDYRHRWNTLKGRIYQLFEQTNLVLQRITEFEKAIAVAETGENSNCITPPYRYTTHLSKTRSFHEFVNRLVKYCKKGHSEDTNNLVQGFIKELCESLDKLKAESTKLLYHISKLLCISGDFEQLDKYILEAIFKNILSYKDTEKLFKENINGFVHLLVENCKDYKSRFSAIKACLNRTLGNSRFVMQRIGELETFIIIKKTKSPNIIYDKTYIATINEVRKSIAESEQIINAVPLDLEALSEKTETLCNYFDFINDLMVNVQIKEMPFPLKDLNDKYIKPLLQKTKTFSKNSEEEKKVIKMLLDINEKLIKYVSFEDTKLLFNLFDRIEYLRLHKDIWSEYNFKATIKQAYEVGERIYNNLESYELDQNRKEVSLGRIGEICRAMAEFEVCKPDEKIDLLLKSNDILQKGMVRNGVLILKYFGRNYLRIGLNYMDLKQWKDAIECFMKIKDIDEKKGVKKKIAFEAMDKIADCYIKLGLEEKFQDMSGSTQYFLLAEKFYTAAGNLTKSSSDDGKHLLGKLANLYYFSSQHGKALPLYERNLQNESPPPEDKNLYDCSSYRRGVCLYFIDEIDKAIDQFNYTLNRHPEKEQKIKSYFWLLRLYSIKHDWVKYEETKKIYSAIKSLRILLTITN